MLEAVYLFSPLPPSAKQPPRQSLPCAVPLTRAVQDFDFSLSALETLRLDVATVRWARKRLGGKFAGFKAGCRFDLTGSTQTRAQNARQQPRLVPGKRLLSASAVTLCPCASEEPATSLV